MVPWTLFQDDYFGFISILLTKTQESLHTTISNLLKRKKVRYRRKVFSMEKVLHIKKTKPNISVFRVIGLIAVLTAVLTGRQGVKNL